MAVKKSEQEEPEVRMRDGANGSKYKFVGTCRVCGKELWKCTTAPNFDMGIEVKETAVFVANARNTGGENREPLETYCKDHNPYKSMQRSGLKPGDALPGDLWSPQSR